MTAFPLPPPPDQDIDLDDFDGAEHAYATLQADVTAELPRLPEVDLLDEVAEVDVDERPLAGSSHLHRAGPTLPGEHAPRARTQGGLHARQRKTPARLPTAGAFAPPPKATPRADGDAPALPGPEPLSPLPAPRPTTATAQPQLIAGRYRIVQRIGQGGMGKVYKVTHAHLSRTFALKIITDPGDAGDTRDLFYREARFASAMSHPNITQVVDFGEDDSVGMFMVMELVEGEPLNKILFEQKRLSVKMACEIALQVAEALHYIHQNNVVHCDIKTENILVGEDASGKRRRLHIKLLDFGLARSLTAARTTATLSGTPHYVAPERIRGEPATPASDVYGLGILLYEMLTGNVPWDGAVETILQGHIEQEPTPPSQLIETGLDPAVEQLILRALAKSPADRHKDMAAFIYELRTVIDMLGFRRRDKGPSRRIVIERSASTRDAHARLAFDGCRLPLALLSADGLVLAANPAFARFVMGLNVEIENLPLRETPLAAAWTTSAGDIIRTLTGQPVRRILEIGVSDEAEVRRLLLWLDPVSRDQVMMGVQPLEV
ncbi:MAG: protein kinase [Myxococcales bacterium]|nr:protein kinase [Myxococcales bacterium]